jgi:hypothetical protein
MVLRFIEYIKIDDKELSLYIIQEEKEPGRQRYRVEVHNEVKFEFFLCREQEAQWQIVTDMFPEVIIKKLLSTVVASIEQRLQTSIKEPSLEIVDNNVIRSDYIHVSSSLYITLKTYFLIWFDCELRMDSLQYRSLPNQFLATRHRCVMCMTSTDAIFLSALSRSYQENQCVLVFPPDS